MSQRFPVCSAKDVIGVLRKRGFSQGKSERQSTRDGRHSNGRQVIVATHGNKPIPIGTLKSIIEGSGLSPDDFR